MNRKTISATKQFYNMPTNLESLRRSSALSEEVIPFLELLTELAAIMPTQPNASYGYDRVVNVTRLPQ